MSKTKKDTNEKNTYKIIAQTDGYIASRDAKFKGNTCITIEDGLTLKEAQRKLLDMYNKDYDTAYSNWGLVRNHNLNTGSYRDGTRSYQYDSRRYSIEKEPYPTEWQGVN